MSMEREDPIYISGWFPPAFFLFDEPIGSYRLLKLFDFHLGLRWRLSGDVDGELGVKRRLGSMEDVVDELSFHYC